MKIITQVTFIFLVFSLLLLIQPQRSLAGSECQTAGGTCKTIRYGRCPDGEESIGASDCQGAGSTTTTGVTRCCVPFNQNNDCYTRGAGNCSRKNATQCPANQFVCCPNTADCPVLADPPGTSSNTGPCVPGTNCGEIDTALGKISTKPAGFVSSILKLAVGVGGGIALLLMLYGFFTLTTSAGNPDKVKAGQEVITSAIGGLIFIIFSVILMQIIGVNIFGIPGL